MHSYGIQTLNSYFNKSNDLSNLVLPLVQSLQWSGDIKALIESLPHFSDKLTITELLNFMSELDYNYKKFTLRPKEIKENYFPCLFIPAKRRSTLLLLEKSASGIIAINGETNEKMVLSSAEIKQKGLIFCFSRMKESEISQTNSLSLLKFLGRYKSFIGQILTLTFFYNLFMAAIPLFVMIAYDKLIPSESLVMIAEFTIGILIFICSIQFMQYLRIKLVAYLSTRIDKTIGESIINHLLHLPPNFTENNTVGSQVSRIKDFESVIDFFSSQLLLNLSEVIFTIVFVVIIYFIGGWLALIPVALGAVFVILYGLFTPGVRECIKNLSTENSVYQSFLLESFTNFKTIKEFGVTEKWIEKHDVRLLNLHAIRDKAAYYNTLLGVFSDFLMMLAALMLFAFGTYMAIERQISLGALIAIMMLIWKVLSPLKVFFAALPKISQIIGSLKQLNYLLELPTESHLLDISKIERTAQVKIEFNRVSYKYRKELPPAILGVSFVVEPGEIVCVTGKNSSGKSTLLRLIMNMYVPQTGQILINNMNTQQFDPVELRHAIAYMPKENEIFFGTIKQNLRFGNILATNEEIEIACRMANVYHDIMQMPDRFETQLSDQSERLFSASFVQKLILARTYLKKSSIRLFDEPTNNLDIQEDQQFIEVMKWLKNNSTIFIVTHRPSFLKMADKILYLNDGQLELFGSPNKVYDQVRQRLA